METNRKGGLTKPEPVEYQVTDHSRDKVRIRIIPNTKETRAPMADADFIEAHIRRAVKKHKHPMASIRYADPVPGTTDEFFATIQIA